jgi:hypothetical protein
LLADGAAPVRGGTTDLLLDRVETGNALQDLVADGQPSFEQVTLDPPASAIGHLVLGNGG